MSLWEWGERGRGGRRRGSTSQTGRERTDARRIQTKATQRPESIAGAAPLVRPASGSTIRPPLRRERASEVAAVGRVRAGNALWCGGERRARSSRTGVERLNLRGQRMQNGVHESPQKIFTVFDREPLTTLRLRIRLRASLRETPRRGTLFDNLVMTLKSVLRLCFYKAAVRS